jgi:hypothetical protein
VRQKLRTGTSLIAVASRAGAAGPVKGDIKSDTEN